MKTLSKISPKKTQFIVIKTLRKGSYLDNFISPLYSIYHSKRPKTRIAILKRGKEKTHNFYWLLKAVGEGNVLVKDLPKIPHFYRYEDIIDYSKSKKMMIDFIDDKDALVKKYFIEIFLS
jgi:hypothetical protein